MLIPTTGGCSLAHPEMRRVIRKNAGRLKMEVFMVRVLMGVTILRIRKVDARMKTFTSSQGDEIKLFNPERKVKRTYGQSWIFFK
jgi:hypothetical protein